MDCNDINDPAILRNYFKSNEEPTITRVFNCFNTKFFDEFMLFSSKEILSKRPFTRFKEDELVREAFNEGLFSFYLFIKEKGFEYRGATIKTFFFEFCKRKLLGLTKVLQTRSLKHSSGDPDIIISESSGAYECDYDTLREETEKQDKRETLLLEAFAKLGEKCSNLIKWRKLLKLSNEEISNRTGLKPNSVTNEVFKCVIRLKKIGKDLENNMNS